MADTGIDLDNCLFHDTRFTNYRSMLRTLADGSQRLEMPDHRKVVQYHIPKGTQHAWCLVHSYATFQLGLEQGRIARSSLYRLRDLCTRLTDWVPIRCLLPP